MVRAADQRASDAERDEVIDLLRAAAGEGRIGHDELDERVAQALSAKTFRQLNATVDDIPRAADGRARGGRLPTARRRVATWTVSAVRRDPWLLVFVIPGLVITLTFAAIAMMIWLVAIVAVLALGGHPRGPTRQRRRSGWVGHGPGAPGRGGIAGSGWRWS